MPTPLIVALVLGIATYQAFAWWNRAHGTRGSWLQSYILAGFAAFIVAGYGFYFMVKAALQ